jgi:hypothetical protein
MKTPVAASDGRRSYHGGCRFSDPQTAVLHERAVVMRTENQRAAGEFARRTFSGDCAVVCVG